MIQVSLESRLIIAIGLVFKVSQNSVHISKCVGEFASSRGTKLVFYLVAVLR